MNRSMRLEPTVKGFHRRFRRGVLAAALVLLVLSIVLLSDRIDLRPIDWSNYRVAASNLASGRSPYQGVEFFGPPWLAMAFLPFAWMPPDASATFWLLLSIAAAYLITWLSGSWLGFPVGELGRIVISAASTLFPVAMYVYITGQVSALSALALVTLAVAPAGRRTPLMVIAVLVAAFKPHIVALPLILLFLEHLRRRAWRVPAMFTGSLVGAALISFLVVPNWPTEWLATILAGEFRGGPGLAARGYAGLREAGVPEALLVLPAAYSVTYWWRHGLSSTTLGLAISSGLIWLPYVRAYDYIVLWPAALAGAQQWLTSRWRAVAAVPVLSLLLLPLTDLGVLLPVVLYGMLAARQSLVGSNVPRPA